MTGEGAWLWVPQAGSQQGDRHGEADLEGPLEGMVPSQPLLHTSHVSAWCQGLGMPCWKDPGVIKGPQERGPCWVPSGCWAQIWGAGATYTQSERMDSCPQAFQVKEDVFSCCSEALCSVLSVPRWDRKYDLLGQWKAFHRISDGTYCYLVFRSHSF